MGRVSRVLVLASAISITFGAATQAHAAGRLSGQYAFTGTAYCLVSPGGFNASQQPIGSSYSSTYSMQGTFTFSINGTGKVNRRVVAVNTGATPNAGSTKSQHSFKYTVDNVGGFSTALVPGSFHGTELTGPAAGATFTLDKLTLSGMISNDRRTLTLTSINPEVATQTISNGVVRPQICYQSDILVWMHN